MKLKFRTSFVLITFLLTSQLFFSGCKKDEDEKKASVTFNVSDEAGTARAIAITGL